MDKPSCLPKTANIVHNNNMYQKTWWDFSLVYWLFISYHSAGSFRCWGCLNISEMADTTSLSQKGTTTVSVRKGPLKWTPNKSVEKQPASTTWQSEMNPEARFQFLNVILDELMPCTRCVFSLKFKVLKFTKHNFLAIDIPKFIACASYKLVKWLSNHILESSHIKIKAVYSSLDHSSILFHYSVPPLHSTDSREPLNFCEVLCELQSCVNWSQAVVQPPRGFPLEVASFSQSHRNSAHQY